MDQDRRVRIGSRDPNIRWLSPALLPESRMYSNFHQPARNPMKDEKGKRRKRSKREGKEKKRKQGFTTGSYDRNLAHDNPHLSTTLRLFPTPSRRPFRSEREEGKKEGKRKKQSLDDYPLDSARPVSENLLYSLFLFPPACLPYPIPIPIPRDQNGAKRKHEPTTHQIKPNPRAHQSLNLSKPLCSINLADARFSTI